jgi:hypothetical protein
MTRLHTIWPLALCAIAGSLFDARLAAAGEPVNASRTPAPQGQEAAAIADSENDSSLTDAEQAFVDLLTNSVLVGHYSIEGRSNGGAKPERYEISRVTKVGGDNWIVQARITYGKVDIPVPVPVHVHWAGDTPVISLTDRKIPGLGEGFTTRVLFYKDRYAGSWYHGQAGGHMWGKIEKAPAPSTSPGR